VTVPDFQTLMLPLLKLTADGQEHWFAEAIESLAIEFHLSDEDRGDLIPSGKQSRLENRVRWAYTYMNRAGLLERTTRGKFKISQRGKQVLASQPAAITTKFLGQFSEFVTFKSQTSDPSDVGLEPEPQLSTPDENLEASYERLRSEVAQELLEQVKKSSPTFFEKLVVDLLVAMGYGGSRSDAGQAVGQSGDDGIDGIIKEDKLGLDVVYIQAKRWNGIVGRPVVQGFAGSIEGQRARKGVMITTSSYTKEAIDYVTRIEKRIVLIDGPQLAELMLEHDVGVTQVATYTVKKVDTEYFGED
jgi:restriction system protein